MVQLSRLRVDISNLLVLHSPYPTASMNPSYDFWTTDSCVFIVNQGWYKLREVVLSKRRGMTMDHLCLFGRTCPLSTDATSRCSLYVELDVGMFSSIQPQLPSAYSASHSASPLLFALSSVSSKLLYL